jgi:hypothetical protein
MLQQSKARRPALSFLEQISQMLPAINPRTGEQQIRNHRVKNIARFPLSFLEHIGRMHACRGMRRSYYFFNEVFVNRAKCLRFHGIILERPFFFGKPVGFQISGNR